MRVNLSVLLFLILLFTVYATFTVPRVQLLPSTVAGYIQTLLPTYNTETSSYAYDALFLGDIMLARHVEDLMEMYGTRYPFSRIASTTKSAQYVVGNFEAAVPKVHVPTNDFAMRFSVHETQLRALSYANISHVSLANNHALDYGQSELTHTYESLQAIDVTPFGMPGTTSPLSSSVIDINGKRVLITGIETVSGDMPEAALNSHFNTYATTTEFQIAFIHWGEEYKNKHSKAQETSAHWLIDLGYDAIVGHHPHVVQDIGSYKKAPIFYSLGNFVFDQYFSPMVQEGLMVGLTVDEVLTFTLLPVHAKDVHSSPALMQGEEKESFLKILAERSDADLYTGILSGKLPLSHALATSP